MKQLIPVIIIVILLTAFTVQRFDSHEITQMVVTLPELNSRALQKDLETDINNLSGVQFIETSLICIFGAAILGLSRQLSSGESNFAMGFGILTVVMAIIYISQNMEFTHRIIWYFAAVSGMIIGSGYIFQAGKLIVLIYIILRNSECLLNYLDREPDKSDDNAIENISK